MKTQFNFLIILVAFLFFGNEINAQCTGPVVTATAICTNGTDDADLNEFYISVKVNGLGTDSNGNNTVTAATTTAAVAGGVNTNTISAIGTIYLGPYSHSGTGLTNIDVTISNDGETCTTEVMISEVICGYTPDAGSLHASGPSCDCTADPAGVILAQAIPGSFDASTTSMVYILVDGNGNVVTSNSTGLFSLLANGDFEVYAYNVLTTDLATFNASIPGVGTQFRGFVPAGCAVGCTSPAAYTIDCVCFICPTVAALSATSPICSGDATTDLTATIADFFNTENLVSDYDVEFLYSTSPLTTAAAIYGATATIIGTEDVTMAGVTSVTEQSFTLPTVTTTTTYYIYARIATPLPTDASCRPFATTSIVVNPLPIANAVTLELCDDGDGTVIFNLTDAEDATTASNLASGAGTAISNAPATDIITYHTASPATAANEIATPTAYAAIDGATVTALVTSADFCTSEATVTLTVPALPTVNAVTLEICDDGDGMVDFNLTDAEDATAASNIAGDGGTDVDNGSTVVTVTYHTASPATGANQVANSAVYPALSGDMVIALVTSADGCTSEATVTLIVPPLPVANAVTLELCDDGDGTVDFNLTDAEDAAAASNVASGAGTVVASTGTVTYHSASPATAANQIAAPTAHAAMNGSTVTALVTSADGCTSEATVTLTVPALLTVNAVTLELCDDGDGTVDFNLTDAEDAAAASNVASGAGTDVDNGSTTATVTYHTASPASAANQIAAPTAYAAMNGATVTALVTSTDGCTSEATVTLTVPALPTVNAVTLELCDDGDGTVDFNLTDAEDATAASNVASGAGTDVDNGSATATVSYHTGSPATAANLIAAPTAFAAMDGATVTALVTSTDGCTSEAIVTLTVPALPTVNAVTLLLCDDGDGTVFFNLTDAEDATAASNVASGAGTDVDNGSTIVTVTYHTASPASAANEIATPTAFAGMNGATVTALVTSTDGCVSEATVTLTVPAVPVANVVTLQICDDGDGTVDFNLTDAEDATAASNVASGIAGDVDDGSTTVTVTYHTARPASAANQIAAPTAFAAMDGTIVTALVTSAVGCTNQATITLRVPALPTVNPVTLELCDDGDGTVDFNLTDAEDATAASNVASGAGTDVDNGSTTATVTYHTASPATAANQIATPTAFAAMDGATVTALVTSADGCTSEATVTLTVPALPVVNPATLQLCDDGDGTVDFDLTDAEDAAAASNVASGAGTDVDNGSTTVTVTYHTASPATAANQIATPTAFAAMDGATVTALVTSVDGCVSETTVTLVVPELPTAAIAGSTTVCSTAPDATITFAGTPLAQITYSDGTNTLMVSLDGTGNASVAVSPTATTTYTLVSIVLASTGCTQPLTGSAIVTVNNVDCSSFPWNGVIQN